MNTRILFVRDLALILDITQSGVRKMYERRQIPLRKFGRKLGILESDFIEWARLRAAASDDLLPNVRSKYTDLLRGAQAWKLNGRRDDG